MTLLVTKTDISAYKQVSDTLGDKIINPFILDAQFNDLQKLLGPNFYNDLIANSTDAKYVTLLTGGSYTYNSVTYQNHGLKSVICLYAYARYILFGSNIDTPFGFVEKLTNESQAVSYEQKKSISKDAQNTAFIYWENVRDFLRRNSSTYPLFLTDCNNNVGGFKISKI